MMEATRSQNNLFKVVGIFIFLSMIMIACFYVLWSKICPADPQPKKTFIKSEKEVKIDREIFLYPLEAFTINLADRDTPKYLRMEIVLELTGEAAKTEITKHISQIRDTIFMIVPQKKVNDVMTADGRAELIAEIMDKLNILLKEVSISNIFFTEYIIQ